MPCLVHPKVWLPLWAARAHLTPTQLALHQNPQILFYGLLSSLSSPRLYIKQSCPWHFLVYWIHIISHCPSAAECIGNSWQGEISAPLTQEQGQHKTRHSFTGTSGPHGQRSSLGAGPHCPAPLLVTDSVWCLTTSPPTNLGSEPPQSPSHPGSSPGCSLAARPSLQQTSPRQPSPRA